MDNSRKTITVDAVLNDGAKKQNVSEKKKVFDPKNYLNTKLEISKGETFRETKIRLLPIDKDSTSPFKRIMMHSMSGLPKEISPSGFKSYVCLEKTEGIDHEKFGKKCPFCELNREAYKRSTEATDPDEKRRWQKISLDNKPNEVGILRCIERGHEEDGPKFLKANIRQDGMDLINKIKKIFNTRYQESIEMIEDAKRDGEDTTDMHPLNILDLDEGKDFKLTFTSVRDKNTGEPTDKTSIDIADYGSVKPLSNNPELRDKWVEDPKVWSEVFTLKPYEYLKLLIDGERPWFSKKQNKYITKEEFDKEQEDGQEDLKYHEEDIDKKINEQKVKVTNIAPVKETQELPF